MSFSGGKFLLFLLAILIVVFGIHIGLLFTFNKALFGNMIITSYLINYVLAALLLLIVKLNIKKESSNTAFIFLAISGLKFIVFFVEFYPYYQEDGIMQRIEFAAFFVPYATCLILEVFYLSKQLNNQDYSKPISEEKKEIK